MIVAGAGAPGLDLGRATRSAGAWWCPTRASARSSCASRARRPSCAESLESAAAAAAGHATVLDVTTVLAARHDRRPARARDVRALHGARPAPGLLPLQGFRPGSVARTPGAVLREDEDRFLMLFGAALGQYVWTVVADAARAWAAGQ